MGRQALERKLDALVSLRSAPATPEAIEQLAKALADRNNYAVSKAAALAGEWHATALVPALLSAFDRFMADAPKTDPQCWAKTAIAKCLAALGHDDPEVFVSGLRHVQMEPVWGGREDTAPPLRGVCALALTACRMPDFEKLAHLTDALVDGDKTVRTEAARAIAQVPGPESALLLRLKALVGDRDSEVTGQCLSSLLGIESAAVGFVARFLANSAPEVRAEAAAALAQSRDRAALNALVEHWKREKDAGVQAALLGFLGGAVLPEAAEFLLTVTEEYPRYREEAVAALAASRFRQQFEARVAAAVSTQGDARLKELFERYFGPGSGVP